MEVLSICEREDFECMNLIVVCHNYVQHNLLWNFLNTSLCLYVENSKLSRQSYYYLSGQKHAPSSRVVIGTNSGVYVTLKFANLCLCIRIFEREGKLYDKTRKTEQRFMFHYQNFLKQGLLIDKQPSYHIILSTNNIDSTGP